MLRINSGRFGARKGLADGLSMEAQLGVDQPALEDCESALRRFAGMGLAIQVTELSVDSDDETPLGQMRLANRYKGLFALLEKLKADGCAVESGNC